MKYILILITVFCNAVCNGQNIHNNTKNDVPYSIDSVQIWPVLPIDSLRKTDGYKHFRDNEIDSCWFNKDTTFLMFRYYDIGVNFDKLIEDYFDSLSGNIDQYLEENDYEYKGDSTKIFNQKDTINVRYFKRKKLKEYPIQ